MTNRIRVRIAIALVLALVVVVAYLPALDGAYVWDDDLLVARDMRCKSDLLRCFAFPFFPQSSLLDLPRAYYRPLVTASFALFWSAEAQHTANLTLHAINAALLFALALRRGASPLAAVSAALVWALHPRLAEAVVWVAGRTDLLATTFTLLALLAWPLDRPASPARRDGEPARAPIRELLASAFVFCGLLSKEVAIAGAVAIAIASVSTFGTRRGLVRAAPIAVSVVLYGGLRIAMVGLGATAMTATATPLAARVAAPFEALARYVTMTLWFALPWSGRGAAGVVSPLYVVAGVALFFGFGALLYRILRGGLAGDVAAAALACVSLLMALQIVPVALQGSLAADRLLYLPLAGVALLVAGRLSSSTERRAAAVAFVLATVSSFVVRRTAQVFVDDVSFLTTVAERADPLATGARSSVAAVVRDRGAPELACPLFERSREILEKTGRHRFPAYRRTTENLAACLVRVGELDRATGLYRELASENDRSGRVALGLGYALFGQLDFDGAERAFARAAELDPQLAERCRRSQSDVAKARRDRESLGTADHAARARFAAMVGLGKEAEREWSLVVADPTLPVPLRTSGARYLAFDGSIDSAARAIETCPACVVADEAIVPMLEARRQRLVPVTTHRDRILSLCIDQSSEPSAAS